MEIEKQTKSLQDLLHRPLIVGASVSDDYLSQSPGKRLALKYTDKHNIHVIAKNGAPGREIVHRIHEKDLENRSIVIGMDLFFWDSTLHSPQLSLQALHRFTEKMSDHRIPFILGDIPELLPDWQPSRKIIDDEIHKIAKTNPLCQLLPLDRLYKQVLRDGFIRFKEKEYSLWDLVPDGLHIGEVAGNYLAEVIHNLLLSSRRV
jgi:hypothetical protein